MFKKIASGLLMAMIAAVAFAGTPTNTSVPVNVNVQNETLGTGVPGSSSGTVKAYPLPDGTYFVPQYLPGSPTAATIYPRVVDVPCIKNQDGTLTCSGYHWSPEMGRAEYLFIQPRIVVQPAAKVVVQKVVPTKVLPPTKKIHG